MPISIDAGKQISGMLRNISNPSISICCDGTSRKCIMTDVLWKEGGTS